ncbi:4-hydroxy-tetrahydrodipicolinate synthase [Desertimonas flava]|uniref:4-hydroxy-tetrahydrodipicolinate synthase n=1 Tax=Desertimonas flava TaxID=2064846 RepID=UPI000E348E77|nr:4-hydroxy-tetrahydrodipicolinate synthase [Desertimonas flava]
MPRFGRVLTAMVTPFDDELALDIDGAVALAKWLQSEGNEGLVLAGTTGEAPTLTRDEKLQLWETVSAAVTIPVVAGSTGANTAADAHLTAEASKLGVAGILALCPYYSRPSQAGIEAHLRAVADATDLPVVIYDIPIRTGRKVYNDVLLRLARETGNVVGVKDAAGNPARTAQLVAEAPAGFEVYSGDDSFTLPLLAVGAVGLIGVATHWVAPDAVALFDAWERGDTAEARRINARLLDSWNFETGDEAPNPGPAKAMMRHLGKPAGHCRPPMGSDPEWLDARAAEVYERLVAARA